MGQWRGRAGSLWIACCSPPLNGQVMGRGGGGGREKEMQESGRLCAELNGCKIINEAGEAQYAVQRESLIALRGSRSGELGRSLRLPLGGSAVAQIAPCTFCAARRDGTFMSNQIINGVSSHSA